MEQNLTSGRCHGKILDFLEQKMILCKTSSVGFEPKFMFDSGVIHCLIAVNLCKTAFSHYSKVEETQISARVGQNILIAFKT